MITIFTPTFNRMNTLNRLYNSLVAQTNHCFEWLIVDDGSTDETEQVVKSFIKNCDLFKIRYYKQENGGKHRAINKAVSLAKGELFFIVDSDDWLPSEAVKTIYKYYIQILNLENMAGIVGRKYNTTGSLKDTTFVGEWIDITALERRKFNINGEKAEVFKTEILKKYPFPEFENENFISEGIVWNKIASDGFKMRWFNEIIYNYEYLEDGLTLNLRKKYRENPIGYLTYLKSEILFHKTQYLRRMIWYGKAFFTLKNTVDVSIFLKTLGINKFQLFISNFLFSLYKIVRKN